MKRDPEEPTRIESRAVSRRAVVGYFLCKPVFRQFFLSPSSPWSIHSTRDTPRKEHKMANKVHLTRENEI